MTMTVVTHYVRIHFKGHTSDSWFTVNCTIILPTFRIFTCIANFNIEDTFFQASYKTKCINILNPYTTFVIQRMWE